MLNKNLGSSGEGMQTSDWGRGPATWTLFRTTVTGNGPMWRAWQKTIATGRRRVKLVSLSTVTEAVRLSGDYREEN